jgi:hypothetical protein
MEEDIPEGFFERLDHFARQVVQQTWPASVVSLTALRSVYPDLARRIFVEAAVAPIRIFFGTDMTPEIEERLAEIESRFRQEEVSTLLYELELILASRFIERQVARELPTAQQVMGEREKHPVLMRTYAGNFVLDVVVKALVNDYLIKLASFRERRVQILLAMALAGEEALTNALACHASYRKGVVLEAVFSWLHLQGLDDDTCRRITDQVAHGSDVHIEKTLHALEGCAFLGPKTVAHILGEIFTGEREIVF